MSTRSIPALFAALAMAGAGHAYAQDSAYSPPDDRYAQPGYDQPDESYDQPGYAQPDDAYDRPGYDEPPTVGEVTVEAEPAPGTVVRSRPVSFADLDLSGEAGAYTLLGRIDNAARQVCGPDPSQTRDLGDARDYDRCRGEAVDRAVYDVHAPSVTDLYERGAGY